ncbi:hypothetical protein [Azospirillum doebereinerae]|uniref:hypothetical protein n=1 Tax=Azospirillum doebereinerae TaxID=92933 RepID=UPI00163CAFCF|nr:hypothetical protein [Azospirillum doebereinerae]
MPDRPETAEEAVTRTLADCEGNRDAALLVLAHSLINARRGLSAGLLRLLPADRR